MNKVEKIAGKFVNINGEIMLKDNIIAELSKIKNKNISDLVYATLDSIDHQVYHWEIDTSIYKVFKCLAEDIGMGILRYGDTRNVYIMFPDTTLVRYDVEYGETETYANIWEFLCYVFQMEYSDMYEEIDE